MNGGRQNRYVTGSDSMGLTMGTYDTRTLPICRYLHTPGHPHDAIGDFRLYFLMSSNRRERISQLQFHLADSLTRDLS